MRSLKVLGAAAAAALVMASSAQAVMWNPQGTVVAGHGTALTLTSGTGTVTCTIALNTKASGAVATTTNAGGTNAPPTFSGCSNNLGLSPTSVVSDAPWVATATSTTAVSVTGDATINIGGGVCLITATDVTVANNTWSNASHTLTANSSSSFPLTRSGFCPLTSATGTMSGSVAFPSTVTLT